MNAANKNKENPTFNWFVLKRIFQNVKAYKRIFISAFFLTILISSLGIARPILIKKILDDYISTKDLYHIQLFAGILLSTLIVEAFSQYRNAILTASLGQNIILDIRKRLFRHLLEFKHSFFDVTPVGILVTRSVSDVEALADVFSQGFIVIMGDILSLVVFLTAMFWVNWKLSIIVLFTLPLLFFATRIFQRGIKATFQKIRNLIASLNTFVQEHIQGMQVIQLFGREKEEFEKFEKLNKEHLKTNIKSIWFYSIFLPVIEILSSLAIALIILYSSLPIANVKITPGEITFFIILTSMLFRPLRMIADRLNTLQMGMVAAERVFKLMDSNEKLHRGGSFSSPLKGKVEYHDIHFRYRDDHEILKGISFTIQPGEKIAIVGTTGAGKSTVINLLGGYYAPNSGNILLDDVDIVNFKEGHLQEQIAVVLQDVFLFSDTIRNNIMMYSDNISDSEMIEASKYIGAHEFITQLPGGYNFDVKERGTQLSAGQRQMIAFLRAYLHRPAILVLDEATSNIDTETELLIQNATEKITAGRTSIIIAHRLATIKNASKIMVMEHGRIVETGTLDELVKKDGPFKLLYEQQFMTHK